MVIVAQKDLKEPDILLKLVAGKHLVPLFTIKLKMDDVVWKMETKIIAADFIST